MSISIIIPTYNEQDNIAKLIFYLKASDNKLVVQIIVVDGGSTDNTVSFAAKVGATAVVCPHKGRSSQMNYGAALATGDVLYFVHADTFPPKNYITDIVKALKEGYQLGRYRTKFISHKPILKINEWFTRFDFFICMGGDQTLFIRKELFQHLNGFNNEMKLMEEYEFCVRARKKGKYKIMKGTALVSARKYEKNSWWQVQKANYKVVQLYKKGAPQQTLADTYKRMLSW